MSVEARRIESGALGEAQLLAQPQQTAQTDVTRRRGQRSIGAQSQGHRVMREPAQIQGSDVLEEATGRG